jgi:hypothetical protein
MYLNLVANCLNGAETTNANEFKIKNHYHAIKLHWQDIRCQVSRQKFLRTSSIGPDIDEIQ